MESAIVSGSAIVGVGTTGCSKSHLTPLQLIRQAFYSAVEDAGSDILKCIDALIVVPPTIGDKGATSTVIASELGILSSLSVYLTDPMMGAGPISALDFAVKLIRMNVVRAVAVVAGDSFTSLGGKEMLKRMGETINHPDYQDFSQPIVPILYDQVAQWHMKKYGVPRERLREQFMMVPVLMSMQASRHPGAINRRVITLEDVRASRPIGKVTNKSECAWPADGAGACIVARKDLARDCKHKPIAIHGVGTSYRPFFLPDPEVFDMTETFFPARAAARQAFSIASLTPLDIGLWQIYDCFPICFLRFLEESGLVHEGEGGEWIEMMYKQRLSHSHPDIFPVNTHGGLLSGGAPWATPAIFSLIEAVLQIRGEAGERQVTQPDPSLVYANGGIFHYSAVAIIGED
ncbi:MAG: thiolase family protein [Candidatus Niyogibacteria bacterium]|nr:thiolase family protein [Candidatus Niyogibacteria bacterium]